MNKRQKVAIVGSGKRVKMFYGPILKSMSDQFDFIGLTSRTKENRDNTAKMFGVSSFSSLDRIREEGADFVICCVTPESTYDVVSEIVDKGMAVLVETPVTDPRLVEISKRFGARVSVIEQWPHLPLEQFKKKIITSGLIGDVFIVENDCRLLDYHGISILRNYFTNNKSTPTHVSGFSTARAIPTEKGLANDSWDVGMVKFNDESILIHKFSYQCKSQDNRGMQSIRAIGEKGCVISSSIINKNDDFETVHVSYNHNGKTHIANIEFERENGVTHWIKCNTEIGEISWNNDFNESYELDFDDHKVGIASQLISMRDRNNNFIFDPPYAVSEAYMDNALIHAIKHSASSGGTLKVG
jgi:predicted dehydrogenase